MNLRYLISIYNKVATKDDYGGEDIKFELLDTVFADVNKKKGNEVKRSKSQTAKRQVTFYIRWRNDITESSIIRFSDERGTNDYNIKSIKEDYTQEYKMYLRVKCEMTSNVVKEIIVPTEDFIILEDGYYILLESANKINLE